MNKVIKDGKVAVLISRGYGAGWYSWNDEILQCLFEPEVVKLVLQDKLEEAQKYMEEKYPDGYWGGARGLTVEWVTEGEQVKINEYDGAEYLEYRDDNTGWVNV